LTWEVKAELVVGVEYEDEEGAASKSSRIIITVIVKQKRGRTTKMSV
jgi:hypothetical protein